MKNCSDDFDLLQHLKYAILLRSYFLLTLSVRKAENRSRTNNRAGVAAPQHWAVLEGQYTGETERPTAATFLDEFECEE